MDVRTDGDVPSATEEVVLRWTLELRDYLDAFRPSVAVRVGRSVRILVVSIVLWIVLMLAFIAAEMTVVDQHVPSPTAVLANFERLFRWPLVVPLVVLMALVAAFVMLAPWWRPELAMRRTWRRSPRVHGPWEAMLEPTGITVRRADGETRHRWTAFDAVSEVGLSYRLRLRGTKPPVYTVIPKRAMPGANGPATLGELLRSRLDGDGAESR